MKKKIIVLILGIILALSSGCGERSAASRLIDALENAGFMYEEDFNAAYYGGRFETAEQMYEQLCRDGVSGLIVPVEDENASPGAAEYSAYELSGIYLDAGSLFFPSAARLTLAEFESAAAAESFFRQSREELLSAENEPAEDTQNRLCVMTTAGRTLLSRNGKTVLIISGEDERAFAAAERIGY